MMRFNGLIQHIAVLTFALMTPVMAADPEIENFMDLGQVAFNQGDINAAMDWFRLAADKNHAPAQVRLGEMLDYSEQNEQAFEWFRRAAELGSADGEYRVGVMYATGEGVDQDYEAAIRWFTLAAEHDQLLAIRSLIKTYENGGLGMEPNHAKSAFWLKHGAKLADHWATTRLKTVCGVTANDRGSTERVLRDCLRTDGINARTELGGRYQTGTADLQHPLFFLPWSRRSPNHAGRA